MPTQGQDHTADERSVRLRAEAFAARARALSARLEDEALLARVNRPR